MRTLALFCLLGGAICSTSAANATLVTSDFNALQPGILTRQFEDGCSLVRRSVRPASGVHARVVDWRFNDWSGES